MIAWLLNRVEKAPTSLFRRSELLKQSKSRFNKLKRAGFLLYVQPNKHGMSYPCPVPDCGNGCPMDIMKMDGNFYAVCREDDKIEPILLSDDDIARYRFSIDVLIESVRRDNGFTGTAYQITSRLYFIGERVVNERNTAFVLACFPSIRAAEPHLLALPARLPGQYAQIVIVTPSLDLSREPIYPRLLSISIFPVSLPATFGKRNFKFSYLSALKRRPPAGVTTPTPGLSPKQQADYQKHSYLCQDELNIPGTFPRKRSNDVFINGHKISLSDSLFALLMRFVMELKKRKGGWVNTADLMAEGFINDIMLHQPYSNLRSKLEGSLKEKDGQKFIESSGSMEYRLSTHPDFVTFDRKKLKTHPDPQIQKLFK